MLAVALLAPAAAHAQTGAITGTVTDETTGAPLGGIGVWIYQVSTGWLWATVTTDAAGVYTASSLPDGQYRARTVTYGPRNYMEELYDNVEFCHVIYGCNVAAGTLIPVAGGLTTSGIDFALTPGGIITGTITDATTGAPVAGVSVVVVPSIGEFGVSYAYTDESGQYTAVKVPTGSWIVRATPPSGSPYAPADYNNGTPVPATIGATTSGIDFTLSTGGRIAGTVTDSVTGAPLFLVQVLVYNQAGETVANVSTNSSGLYAVEHLAPGLYDLIVGPSSTTHYGQTAQDVEAFENVTTTVNFALAPSSSIFGWLRDATTGFGMSGVVELRTTAGALVAAVSTFPGGEFDPPEGMYWFSRIPFGTYVLRGRGVGLHVDEAYDDIQCLPECGPAIGTVITAAPGVNFSIDILLERGGRFGGQVRDALTAAPLPGVRVGVYAANGALVADVVTNGAGNYLTPGLPAGTYYARTSNTLGYQDRIYNNQPFCIPSCQVTDGQPIAVAVFATTTAIDFTLTPAAELVQNGTFSAGLASWGQFATPDLSYIVVDASSGVLRFHRVAPPPGTSNQAVVLQQTGAAVPNGSGLLAQFELGNTSVVRKRISVLIHDSDFGDLANCTFWLPPNTPRRPYAIRAHTTKAWTNATIAFYAASAGSNGGAYEIDDVSLQVIPAAPSGRSDCIDALAKGTVGITGPNVLANGDFSSGALAPGWGLFGQINGAVTNGVFEFVKLAGVPAGVILQPTGYQVAAGEQFTATFKLGNPSSLRQRLTVLLHDADFSDLSACTFWLPPGQPLSTYSFKTFTTEAWTSATISFYPSTVAPPGQWMQLDDVTLRRTPSQFLTGTECIEPVGGGVAPSVTPMSMAQMPSLVEAVDLSAALDRRVSLRSWIGGLAESWRVRIEISTDGVAWTRAVVVATEDGRGFEIDLSEYVGERVFIRYVFDPRTP